MLPSGVSIYMNEIHDYTYYIHFSIQLCNVCAFLVFLEYNHFAKSAVTLAAESCSALTSRVLWHITYQ